MKKMRTWTWEQLIAFHRADELRNQDRGIFIKRQLRNTPKKYRCALAAALSVAKWHPSRTKIDRGYGACALCCYQDLYVKRVNQGYWGCDQCPLSRKTKSCNQENSLWRKATSQGDKDTGWDNQLYNILVEIYSEEWEKL